MLNFFLWWKRQLDSINGLLKGQLNDIWPSGLTEQNHFLPILLEISEFPMKEYVL